VKKTKEKGSIKSRDKQKPALSRLQPALGSGPTCTNPLACTSRDAPLETMCSKCACRSAPAATRARVCLHKVMCG
jgi:hypothetical protein